MKRQIIKIENHNLIDVYMFERYTRDPCRFIGEDSFLIFDNFKYDNPIDLTKFCWRFKGKRKRIRFKDTQKNNIFIESILI